MKKEKKGEIETISLEDQVKLLNNLCIRQQVKIEVHEKMIIQTTKVLQIMSNTMRPVCEHYQKEVVEKEKEEVNKAYQ